MAIEANKVTLCWPNRIDQATLSLGSWSASLPLDNLKNRVIAKKARTTDDAEANTKFNIALDKARPVLAVALAGHNFSADARWRVRFYADYARTVLKWDSGGAENIVFARSGATATRFKSDGKLETVNADTIRYDYDPTTLQLLGWLIEETRTNQIWPSRDWSHANFGVVNVGGSAVVKTLITGLDGVANTGVSVSGLDTSGDRVDFSTTISAVSAGTWTYSAFMKGSGQINIAINSTTGVGPSAEITVTLTSTPTLVQVTNTFDGTSTGNIRAHCCINRGAAAPASLEIFEPQIEQGAFATSRIPTTTAAVTRNSDYGYLLASLISNFTTHNITLCTEWRSNGKSTGGQIAVALNENGDQNNQYAHRETGSGIIFMGRDSPSSSFDQGLQGTAAVAGTVYRAVTSIAAGTNQVRSHLNGLAATPTTMPSPTTPVPDRMQFGCAGSNNSVLNGHLRQIRVYSGSLTDAQQYEWSTTGTIVGLDDRILMSWDMNDLASTVEVAGGRRSVWPSFFEYEQLEWEDDNFWFGDDSLDVTADYTPLATVFADDIKTDVRAILVELFDSENTAGYLEMGRAFVATGWQPPLNADYGIQFGHEVGTTVEEAVDGTEYFDRKRARRTVQFQLSELPTSDAFGTVYPGQRDLGVDKEVLFAYNVDDSDAAYLYRTFLARMLRVDPITQPYYERHNAPFMLREIL